MYTIDQWMRHSYGLLLDTDRPEWRLVSGTGQRAAAHAAGFITSLDFTDSGLSAQLASSGREPIDPAVQMLAVARDLAWQCITALAVEAHQAGCVSLATGACPNWTPVCVRADEFGPKLYPALARTTDAAATPPRLTRQTIERISDDLALQTEPRVSIRVAGTVITVTHGDNTAVRPSKHEPDHDGLYTLGSGNLHWQQPSGGRPHPGTDSGTTSAPPADRRRARNRHP